MTLGPYLVQSEMIFWRRRSSSYLNVYRTEGSSGSEGGLCAEASRGYICVPDIRSDIISLYIIDKDTWRV